MSNEPRNVPFMELDEFHCREVVGTGEDGLATFCGHVKKPGSSYYPHHSMVNELRYEVKAKAYSRSERWNIVGDGTPVGAWLETKREGEAGTNICMCRVMCIGDEPEWIEREGGRTTVTHHSFAAPTHWRWPPEAEQRKP